MSNTEDFDAETEELDGELETPEAAPAKKGKPPAAKKSGGGGFGKFLMLLIILGLGGAAGGEKLGLIKLPFNIPGLSPAETSSSSEMPAPPSTPGTDLAATATGTELAAATGSDAVPPGLEGEKHKAAPPSEMPDPLGAPSEIAATHGKPSIQPPSISAPGISAPGSDPLSESPAADPLVTAPAPAADPLAEIPAPAADPLATAPALASPAPVADPLAEAPAPAADPLATPGGPDMLATPVAPVETTPVAAAPDMSPDMSEDPATPVASPVTAPVAVAPVAAAPDTESLEKIAKLEEKLAAAEKKSAASEAALAKAEARATAAEATAGRKARQQAAAPVSATGEVPVAKPRTKRQPRVAATAAAAPAPIVATSRWVLKSAKPGVAWVAQPGSNELKTIAVGDTVTGLGKVTAIAKDDSGRWVVNGTKGRINQ